MAANNAKTAGKTITVEQIGSKLRRPADQEPDPDRPRPEQDEPPPHARGYARRYAA